jgi:GTP-binding protein
MGDHATRGRQALKASAAAPEDVAAALEAGRRLFAAEARFSAGVEHVDELPAPGLPEVAFAGRSNVGKSSLINALTGRKSLARTSQTPGRTRQLNFFVLGGRLLLVDLPGYGYAKAPKRQAGSWQRLLHAYLRGRPTLGRTMLLIDARHGLKESDREMMADLDAAAVGFQIVLTKADRCGEEELKARTSAIAGELARHPAAHPEILPTSAKSGRGIAELRAALAMLASAA